MDASFSEVMPSLSSSLLESLATRGVSAPSPIQREALPLLSEGESALLAAETGSGKSLAFLLPTLTRLGLPEEETLGGGVITNEDEGCVMVVAPTRELALQLASVAKEVIAGMSGDDTGSVELLVVGGATSAKAIGAARCIVATPREALTAFTTVKLGAKLQRVRSIVLDEVDALLPPKKKDYRSAQSKERATKKGAKKRIAGKDTTPASDAESLLKLLLRSNSRPNLQVVGASATASRKTLDLIKSAVRSDPYGRFANKELSIIRVLNSDEEDQEAAPRSVVVPRAVEHQYTVLDRGSDETAAMVVISKALEAMKPRSALVFLSAGSKLKVSKSVQALVGLQVQASALHQAMALDKDNRKSRDEDVDEAEMNTSDLLTRTHADVSSTFAAGNSDAETPVLVTFEASARGLHFDAVDVVFVVGLPVSASSYLHLAGRTGRRLGDGVRPGTVVTLAPPRAVAVLESWSKQLGDVEFSKLDLASQKLADA